MIIDFHTHCFPDELAAKAIPALSECAGIPPRLNGTLADLKESMRRAEVARSVVLSIATKPSQTERINSWAGEIQDGEVIAFGSIHPDYALWKQEIGRMKELGLRGIKLHPDYQNFFVDEERMFPLYEFAIERGFVLLFHAGLDIGLPPPCHCTPDRLARVVKRYPGGNIVAAHMGGFSFWEGVEQYLVGEDVYFDTAYTFGHIEEERLKRIILQHGYERILFATDSPWKDQAEEIEKLKKLGFSREIENTIFYGNAVRLLHLSP